MKLFVPFTYTAQHWATAVIEVKNEEEAEKIVERLSLERPEDVLYNDPDLIIEIEGDYVMESYNETVHFDAIEIEKGE